MTATILVVDDDPLIQLTVAGILEDEGYTVVVAGDGLEALAQLVELRPAAILLDIGMPRMDGYAFATELERRGLRAALPVIVLTADGRAAEKAAQVGAQGFLAKPFTLPTLVAEVARVAGR
jgi:two-component system, chemotaxis family, chemotaxis protein CheY